MVGLPPSLPKPLFLICMQVPVFGCGAARCEEPGQKLTGLLASERSCRQQNTPRHPVPGCPLSNGPSGWHGTQWKKQGLPGPSPCECKSARSFGPGAFALLNKICLLPMQSGDWPYSSACGAAPPAGDRNKRFGKGEGSMRGEGEPFSKRGSLSPHQTYSSAILPRTF